MLAIFSIFTALFVAGLSVVFRLYFADSFTEGPDGVLPVVVMILSGSALSVFIVETLTGYSIDFFSKYFGGTKNSLEVVSRTSLIQIVLFPLTYVSFILGVLSGFTYSSRVHILVLVATVLIWLYLAYLRVRGVQVVNDLDLRSAAVSVFLSHIIATVFYLGVHSVTTIAMFLLLFIAGG